MIPRKPKIAVAWDFSQLKRKFRSMEREMKALAEYAAKHPESWASFCRRHSIRVKDA
jgi:hypothetical protein